MIYDTIFLFRLQYIFFLQTLVIKIKKAPLMSYILKTSMMFLKILYLIPILSNSKIFNKKIFLPLDCI